MIEICDDLRPIRVRATSAYFGSAVSVLSRRDQPQHPGIIMTRRLARHHESHQLHPI
jgi:hypothetical protein